MKTSSITLNATKSAKQRSRERIAETEYLLADRSKRYEPYLSQLATTQLGTLDRKVKHGESLSFDEAFCGTCTVIMATNAVFYERFLPLFEQAYGSFSHEKALALGSAFLNLMATKEALSSLTAEEVAGMAAAGGLDTVISLSAPYVVETSGTGGDRGFNMNGGTYKSINASTLSALVLAGMGLRAVKHGSYGNTYAVGSTDMIESFGAKTSMNSRQEVEAIWNRSGFCFFDAHWCKTIHDLSHLLMMETVNHVIGPMTPPICESTLLHKLMGVNEKVHPETIARAYALLDMLELRNTGGVVIVSGLDKAGRDVCKPHDFALIKQHAILDEVSPFASIVSVANGEHFLGSYMLIPEDFGVTIDAERIIVPNEADAVRCANQKAITGTDPHLATYLAMNAALGLFAAEYAHRPDVVVGNHLNGGYLRECYSRCRVAVDNGSAQRVLDRYVSVSREIVGS